MRISVLHLPVICCTIFTWIVFPSKLTASPVKPIYIGYLSATNDTSSRSDLLLHIRREVLMVYEAGFHVELDDSAPHMKCDIGLCVKQLFDMLDRTPNLTILIIKACTSVLKVIGEVAQFWHLSVFGLGSSSAVLRNVELYPTLQLLGEVENTHNPLRVQFVEQMGWSHLATFSEDYEDFSLATGNFHSALLNYSITIEQSLAFINSPTDISRKIHDLKVADWRILLLFGSERVTEDVILSMVSSDYLETRRVIISNQPLKFVPRRCNSFIYIGSPLIQIANKDIGASTELEMIRSLFSQIRSFLVQTNRFEAASDITRSTFTQRFHFHGVYETKVYQYIHSERSYQLIGSNRNGSLIMENAMQWNDNVKPIDKKLEIMEKNTINTIIFMLYGTLCAVGMIVAIGFLVINCKFKNHTLIKMSSPALNCASVVGAMFLYAAVCLMGLDRSMLQPKALKFTCLARMCVLSIGYTLLLSPMCAKTFRVHSIMADTRLGQVTRKKLSDRNLLLSVGGLVILDVVVIAVWQIFDPIKINTDQVELASKSTRDSVTFLTSERCYVSKWIWVIYTYKAGLLLFATYLAWSTRNIAVRMLNDSKSIMLNIYLVLAASVITVVVSLFVRHDATLAYSIIGSLILLGTTIILFILFLPKVVKLSKAENRQTNLKALVRMTSTSLITKSNTRRFQTSAHDDLQEVELKSRVLSNELSELENEIDKLREMALSDTYTLTDLLNTDLLYLLPLPLTETGLSDRVPSPVLLTRRHTPKYKQSKERQGRLIRSLQRDGTQSNSVINKDMASSTHSSLLIQEHSSHLGVPHEIHIQDHEVT